MLFGSGNSSAEADRKAIHSVTAGTGRSRLERRQQLTTTLPKPKVRNGMTFLVRMWRACRHYKGVESPTVVLRMLDLSRESCQRDHSWRNRVPLLFARLNLTLTKYSQSVERKRMLKFFLQCVGEQKCLTQPIEAVQLMLTVEAVRKIPGDMAEVGAFAGATAKMIASSDPQRTLHVFDTFEGLPDPGAKDSAGFFRGQYYASEQEVKQYLQGYNVQIYKGLFPQTAGPIQDKTFAFVHLDVDLYESTKACLEFFYPRMEKGGVILTHDYAARDEGVYRAFHEFFAAKPEPVIELGGNQGIIVKI